MLNPFVMISLSICAYEILSLILPLKFSNLTKIILALLLVSGLAKTLMYYRTPTGFDIYEFPYPITVIISTAYNFLIVALFMVIIKDIIWILWKIFAKNPFPSSYASLFVLSIALCSTLYGTYQGIKVPDVNVHEVQIKNLGKDFDGMKIAMLVDIHADNLTGKEFVQAVVERTNSLKPDLILIPGDFVDGQVDSRSADIAPLKNLNAPLGVYGSSGNHEYYFDFEGWMNEFKNLGVKILENEHVILTSGDSKLIIAGLPDPTGGRMGLTKRDISLTLKNAPENMPVILMDHQPSFAAENAKFNVALQVSGHTHGGQIPGIYSLVKKFNNGFVRGWYEIENMKLYVKK